MGSQSSSRPFFCTVVAVDTTNFFYRVCAVCERTLPENSTCRHCDYKAFNPGSSGSKRVYRILLSIASESKVLVVICFDRAARVLFGCSADEFFNFSKFNPFSAENISRILLGEMLKVTLTPPRSGHAQHHRVASIVPLCSDFSPVIQTLRKLYKFGPPQHVQKSLPEPSECSSLQNSPRDLVPEPSECSRSKNSPRDPCLNYLSELVSRMRTAQGS